LCDLVDGGFKLFVGIKTVSFGHHLANMSEIGGHGTSSSRRGGTTKTGRTRSETSGKRLAKVAIAAGLGKKQWTHTPHGKPKCRRLLEASPLQPTHNVLP